jgi:hypothetical protein
MAFCCSGQLLWIAVHILSVPKKSYKGIEFGLFSSEIEISIKFCLLNSAITNQWLFIGI